MESRIYCDMDGVLVNFVKGAESFYHVNPHTHNSEFNRLWSDSDWQTRLKQEWPTFWADLEPLSQAFALWKLIAPFHPAILTAIPHWWPAAATGKRIWLKRHFPKFGYHPSETFHAVQREEKQHYAKQRNGTPNILIDDHKKNIREWEAAGGIGIVYTNTHADLTAIARHLST